ncbi:acyl-CoA dehydrogenase family protein [Actinomycetes bacterium KLBMP 9797]
MEQTEERRALREAVRRLVEKDPDGHWPRLCGEIGAAGLAIPAEYGGAGASLLESHVVLEELGRVLAPSPLLGSAVLAAQAVLLTGDAAACARLLPDIASGARIAALAWSGADGRWDGAPVEIGPSDVLSGAAHYVLDDGADVLLVAAGGHLYEVAAARTPAPAPDAPPTPTPAPDAPRAPTPAPDAPRTPTLAPDARRTPAPALDATRRLATVEFPGVPARRLGPCPLDRLRAVAWVALSAEQVGTATRALELTVGYVKTRVQFGRPIGAFQALQHRLADLHVRVESARSASYAAASALVEDAVDAPLLAAAARVHCTETLELVAAEMIQMHGGIGITWEHDAHRYFKRAHGTRHLFGHPDTALAAVATHLLDSP